MGELDDEPLHTISPKAKKSKKRSRPFVDMEIQVISNDGDDCLLEHSIPKKKKKKEKRKNEKESVNKDENTQKENHGENTNQVTECIDEIQETNEKTKKKRNKLSRHSHTLAGEEPEQSETGNPEDSSSLIVEKKKNKRKDKNSADNSVTSSDHSNILNKHSNINTIIHHEIQNLEDNCNYREYTSNTEYDSELLSIKEKENSGKSVELSLEDIEISRKKKKKKKEPGKFVEDSQAVSDMMERKTKNKTSDKLKKRKNERRENREEKKSHDESSNSEPSPIDKAGVGIENEEEIEIKKEILDDDNESDLSEGIIFDDDYGTARVKRLQFTDSELKLVKIVAYDESDSEDEIHPLQQHHSLNPESAAKLAAICIRVKHNVPPQHNVEQMAGTRVPTKKEREEIQKYVQIKKGLFNTTEDSKIVRNWKKFCQRYDWDKRVVFPFLHWKQKGFFYLSSSEQRRMFVQILAKGLPNRTLYSVYHRFRNLYSKHKQDRYTKAEDQELLESIDKNLERGERPDYATLAKKFNRTRASVWRRYVLLQKKRREADLD